MSNRDSRSNTETLPTHDEIEKRAYDLYQQGSEEFSATEYWFMAEDELKKATTDNKPPTEKAVAGWAGRSAKA